MGIFLEPQRCEGTKFFKVGLLELEFWRGDLVVLWDEIYCFGVVFVFIIFGGGGEGGAEL